ncbi:MAG: phosphate ABC transporter permease PstA [Micrococcus sp.]|nr:phosphate ABC transporter permease PstA [Micrococcus sp.]
MSVQTEQKPQSGSSAAVTKHTLRAGQPPTWLIPAVAIGALVVAAGLALLLWEGFNLAGWVVLAAILYVVGHYIAVRVISNRRKATDLLWRNVVWLAFGLALVPLVWILWTVTSVGLQALTSPGFLTNDMVGIRAAADQAFMQDGESLAGGIAHALVGTLMITLAATVISVPVGLMTSIYLVEYSRGGLFSRVITFLVDVMTGIPSIVAGLFAAAVMIQIMGPRDYMMGFTAAIALTVLMIPVVVRSTEEMLRVVPNELREASYALGVRKWRTILKVVIPTSISGIAAGVTIAIARVAGETAPILVTAGFVTRVNWDIFNGWMTALPVYIYRQFMHPTAPAFADASLIRAWGGALVLIIIVMALNLLSRVIAKAFAPKKTGR